MNAILCPVILAFLVSVVSSKGGEWPDRVDSARTSEVLDSTDWISIRSACEQNRHSFVANPDGSYQARNPGQAWLAKFDGKGFMVTPDAGGWSWGLELIGYGERNLSALPPLRNARHEKGKISFPRDGNITEWFVNDSRGLEQGWTIQARSSGPSAASRNLTLHFALRGDLTPKFFPDGNSVSFLKDSGCTILTYGGLKAWDADGKTLLACFTEADDSDHLCLTVDDTNARYPITIDPIVQNAYIKASNTGEGDAFGISVAVSGDTVVVGAWGESSNATGVNGDESDNSAEDSGAAYVFVRKGSVWTQQAYLKASNTGADDRFGISVSISGDSIAVGAWGEASASTGVNGDESNDSAPGAGAAYVFVRNQEIWSQQAYIKASNSESNDEFGLDLELSGDTLVVGARSEDSNAIGSNGNQGNNSASTAGAAYVFTRSDGMWSQEAYLKASNTAANLNFGASVAISGDTVVVGAQGDSSKATGVNGNQMNGFLGFSGAAYVFVRSGTIWAQQAYLKASNTDSGDSFGRVVAISGDTVIVGAYGERSSATGVNGNQLNNSLWLAGAAYVFTRSANVWTQQAYLKASNTGETDGFGSSVAVCGDKAVVGAHFEGSSATGVNGNQADNGATAAGAAYLFSRSGTVWTQEAYLKASNTDSSDKFGISVAISGDTLVVGAHEEGSKAAGVNGDPSDNSLEWAGAAYVFGGISASGVSGIEITDTDKTESTFIIDFTSQPGLTGWRIRGSATMDGFHDDLTSVTTFTELTPGIYRAQTDLTGYPSTQYFLRIER